MKYTFMMILFMGIITSGSLIWCEISTTTGLNYCPMTSPTLYSPEPQTTDSSGVFNPANLENTDGQGAYLSASYGLSTFYNLISGTWSFGRVINDYVSMLFGTSMQLPSGITSLINWIGRTFYFMMLYQMIARSGGESYV